MAKKISESAKSLADSIIEDLSEIEGININSTVSYIPTGIDLLDTVMGGGVPTGKLVSITGGAGAGKAHPYSTPILTANGWSTIGEVHVGTMVLTPDGSQAKIVGEFERGILPVYEIFFNDGTSCKCCLDHLWNVKSPEDHKWRTLSLKEILDSGLRTTVDNNQDVLKWEIPVVSSLDIDDALLPVDPHRLGELLSNVSPNMPDADVDELENIGIRAKEFDKYYVPELYKDSSDFQREEFLYGIGKHSDITSDDEFFRFKCYSKQLAEDVAYIARSLGRFVTIDDYELGDGKFEYHVDISFLYATGNMKKCIKDVKYVDDLPCKCIKIDSDDELYIINDFIVTHNTTVAAQYISGFQNHDPESIAIYLDVEQAITKERLCQLGCDPDRTILISKTITVEDVAILIKKVIVKKIKEKKKEVPFIVVWDSESSTPTRKSLEVTDSAKILGEHSRTLAFVLNQLIPIIAESNITLVMIQQLRNKITMNPYAPAKAELNLGDQILTGGSALQYLPFQLAFIKSKGEIDTEKCGFRGLKNEIKFIKNKNFPPRIPIQMVIDYASGYSDFWTKENLIRESKGFGGTARQYLANYKEKTFRRKELKSLYDTDEVFRQKFEELYTEYKVALTTSDPWSLEKKSEETNDNAGLTEEELKLINSIESDVGSSDEVDLNSL